MRSFCIAKASHIFSTENIGIFEILTFEILTKMFTNDIVSFEQPGPVLLCTKNNIVGVPTKVLPMLCTGDL